MVKTLKRMGIKMLMACLFLMLVTACGAPAENDFVGNWKCVSVTQYTNSSNVPNIGGKFPDVPDIDMTESSNDRSTIIIKNGGKAIINLKSDVIDKTIEGTWKYDKSNPDELKVVDDDGNVTIIHKKSDDDIYIEDGADLLGNRYSFTRK